MFLFNNYITDMSQNTKKNSASRYLPLIVVVLVIILSAIGICRRCALESQSRLVEEFRRPHGDTLAVAIELSPLTYSFAHDTAEGFDYELLTDIARRHDFPVVFYPVASLEQAYQGLYDRKYDLLVASMPSTQSLREVFPLTKDVYIDRQVLLQNRDCDSADFVTEAAQLRGDTVYLAEGSPFATRLRNMGRELGDTVYTKSLPEHTYEHLAILTAQGVIPRTVVPEALAHRMVRNYPQLDAFTAISLSQFQVWAVAPGDSLLLDSLNSWIDAFKATPQYDRLVEKYLH